MLVVVTLVASVAPRALGRQALPENPQARRGVLANGLNYLVVRHPAPPGAPPRVAASLRVDFGSLDELDHERGSARAAELLARASILAAPSVGTLRTLGVQPESDLKSGVGYEWCTFSIAVPATAPAQASVRAALEALARTFAAPPPEVLTPEGWAKVRETMDERERAAMGVALRANAGLLPRLMPGSRFATRFPFGTGAVDPGLTAATAEAFRTKWVVVPSASLVVVGDGLELEELEAVTRGVFSRLPGGPRPERLPVANAMSDKPLALVLHDAGLATDFVQLTRGTSVPEGVAGVDTVREFTRDLADRVLLEVVRRRLEAAMAEEGGEPGAQQCVPVGPRRAVMPRFSRSFTITALIAGGPPGSAAELARCLVATARGLLAGPIPEEEVEAARASVLSTLDAEARAFASLSPERVADAFAELAALRDAPISPVQRAELARELMPRVGVPLVTDAARVRLDPDRSAVVALLPASSAGGSMDIGEDGLLAALDTPAPARALVLPAGASGADVVGEAGAAEKAGGPVAAVQKPITLPEHAPPDAVRSAELHPASGVLTAVMSSGVVFHHRAMASPSAAADAAGTRIVLTLSLVAGPATESAQTRALSTMLRATLAQPATPTRNSVAMRRAADAAGLGIDAVLTPVATSLIISARADKAEAAFAFAAEVVSSGVLERGVFERERARLSALAGQGARSPEYALNTVLLRAAFPDDPRPRAPSAEEAGAMDFASAAAFVRGALARAPIEAAVTGDIDRATALDLASRAFAPLPTRRGPDQDVPPALALPAQAVEAVEEIDTPDARAVVLEGFRTRTDSDGATLAALDVAAEVLSVRLTAELRESRRLSMNAQGEHNPPLAWIGGGDLRATASCAAGREGVVREELLAHLRRLAQEPVPEIELVAARQRVAARRAEELSDPAWWSVRLASKTIRDVSLSDLLSAPARTLAITPSQVQAAVGAVATDDRRLSITVKPK